MASLKNILKELGLKNQKGSYHSRRQGLTEVYITYDYQPFMERWNEIYDLMKRKSIKKLEDYKCPSEFSKDVSRVMFETVKNDNSRCCQSFSYTYHNKSIYDEKFREIFLSIEKNDYLDNFKEPILCLTEFNDWEKQRIRYYLPVSKKDIPFIFELYNRLKNLDKDENIDKFQVVLDFKEVDDIDWNSGSYMANNNLVIEKLSWKKLSTMDFEKLFTKFRKGGGLRIKKDW